MAKTVWEVIGCVFCQHTGKEAELLEERIYPDDPLPDAGAPFKVRARKCASAIECNVSGYPCCWAYTNPDLDPFAIV